MANKPKRIKVGTIVRWESQSASYTKTKVGRVVMTEQSAKRRFGHILWTNPRYCAEKAFPDHKHMFDGISWFPHNPGAGVLVEVDGPTKEAKKRLYKPRPELLEVVE